jgi:tetratricopeptide (TPR) repeat protein
LRRNREVINLDIQTLEAQISQIACVSLSTWERFLQGKSYINSETFKACCHTLGLPWQAIAELDLVKSDYETGREVNQLNDAFNFSYIKGDYLEAKKTLMNVVPTLIRDADFLVNNSVIDRLNGAISIAEFLIPKLNDSSDLNLILGDIKSKLGYFQDSLEHYQLVLSEGSEGINKSLATLASGVMYMNTGKYKEAKCFLEKVSSTRNPEIALRANHYQGWVAMYQGAFKNAFILLKDNIEQAKKLENHLTKADAYHFLARTHYEVNEFERAIECLKKQYLILEKKQAPPGMMANSFRWLARCYWKLQDLQSTEHYLSIARHLFEQSHPQFSQGGLAHLYLHRSKIYQKLGNLNEAKAEVQRSIDTWESTLYPKGIGDARFALGQIYEKSANYSDAIKEYEIAHATYNAMGYHKSSLVLKALKNLKS